MTSSQNDDITVFTEAYFGENENWLGVNLKQKG